MNTDEVIQKLETINDYAAELVSDGWYTKQSLLDEIGMAIDAES